MQSAVRTRNELDLFSKKLDATQEEVRTLEASVKKRLSALDGKVEKMEQRLKAMIGERLEVSTKAQMEQMEQRLTNMEDNILKQLGELLKAK